MSEQNGKFSSAFTVWEILILVFIIGFVVAVAIPNFIYVHDPCQRYSCINNLRQIDAATKEFALENHLTNGSPINFPSDLTPYIKLDRDGKMFPCPQGGIYHISKVGETPTCSLGTTVTPAHVLP